MLTDSVPSQKFDKREFTSGLSNGIMVQVKKGDIKKGMPLRGKMEKK